MLLSRGSFREKRKKCARCVVRVMFVRRVLRVRVHVLLCAWLCLWVFKVVGIFLVVALSPSFILRGSPVACRHHSLAELCARTSSYHAFVPSRREDRGSVVLWKDLINSSMSVRSSTVFRLGGVVVLLV